MPPPPMGGRSNRASMRINALSSLGLALALAALCSGACRRPEADPLGGVWRAAVVNKAGEQVPFRLDLKREGGQITGALVNGDDRVLSTGGSFDGRTLRLRYDYYDGELEATLEGGELRGAFTRQWRKETLRREFSATRPGTGGDAGAEAGGEASAEAGAVGGDWMLRVGEGEQQRIWRASFRPQGHPGGGEVWGTVIPLSGDWGTLAGKFADGQLTLSRFDGINAYLFKARLTDRGTLEGMINSERKVVAERAGSEGLPAPPDPAAYTRVRNPAEPFSFSFPDLDGRTVSSTDERFKNKVVIVTVGGSWCPNCHDEAPVLNDLYARYRDRGLEVVALSFEYTGEVARDREQARIFARRHGIGYPVLLAGTTDEGEIERKLPQLVNFGAYPTTVYVGRDGLVKKIHAGFEGPATGERHTRLKAEMEELVRELLEEPTTAG